MLSGFRFCGLFGTDQMEFVHYAARESFVFMVFLWFSLILVLTRYIGYGIIVIMKIVYLTALVFTGFNERM